MKKVIALSIVFSSIFSAPALATDLTNKDSKKYEVKVADVGTLNTSIESNTTSLSICRTSCTVTVVGVGSLKITGKEKVIVIKNGALSLEK
ncbi:hypothetical protein [Chamaesiphon sp. GL140_3_metabinner_50]|uniref:hypothetical protein n=1 Tax=Chamaesiphon sp. GL140_3_metabinner_50 TaxID=2970812 RepID=UPI0025FF69BF|nr:hypothetical protein [Chamaesiphon sp. GL140_3_metabinner_50]